jgi:hypothetical protein
LRQIAPGLGMVIPVLSLNAGLQTGDYGASAQPLRHHIRDCIMRLCLLASTLACQLRMLRAARRIPACLHSHLRRISLI